MTQGRRRRCARVAITVAFVCGALVCTASAGQGPALWQVTPDPVTYSPAIRLLPQTKITVRLPAKCSPKNVLFPSNYGRCVAFGQNVRDSDTREVRDILTRRLVGQFTGRLNFGHVSDLSADGKYIACYALDRRTRKSRTRSAWLVEWLDDNKGLLLWGAVVVDRKLARAAYVLPVKSAELARLPMLGRSIIDDNHVLQLAMPSPLQFSLVSEPLPVAEIAKAATAVAAGKAVDEVDMPEATTVDLPTVRELASLDGPAGAWKYQVDAAVRKRPSFSGRVVVPIAGISISVLAASELGGRCIAGPRLYTVTQPKKTPTCLVDLSKRSVKAFPQTRGARGIAISPDGSRGLFSQTGQAGVRLDVWDLNGARHVVGWRVGPKRESQRGHYPFGFFGFLDNNRVVTINKTRDVIVYTLEPFRTIGKWTGFKNIRVPLILSPTGKYMVRRRNYVLIDMQEYKPSGRLEVPTGYMLYDAVFTPNGLGLVGLCLKDSAALMVLWSMKNGSIVTKFPIPSPSVVRRMQWCGDGMVLVADCLVDLRAKRPVWKYNGLNNDTPTVGNQLLLTHGSTYTARELIPRDIPSQAELAAIKKRAGEPPVKPLIGPGTKVSVSFSCSGPADVVATARKRLTERLEKAGFAVAEGHPIRAVIQCTVKDTGRTVTFQSLGGSGGRQVVRLKEATVTSQWEIGGKVFALRKTSSGGARRGTVRLQRGQTASQYLEQRMWMMVSSGLSGGLLPTVVYPAWEKMVFGTTDLKAGP